MIPAAVVAALVVLGAYAAFDAWRVQRALADADAAARALRTAIDTQDDPGMRAASYDLGLAASRAASRTDGPLWSALGYLPVLGDDVRGVRALSASLDLVATDGVPRVIEALGGFEGVSEGGRVDIARVRAFEAPVAEASAAFSSAVGMVDEIDSSGFVGALRPRFESYVELLGSTDRGLRSARTATQVLPGLVGAEGTRDYLLVFQNNAEIRATGGMPGSWARVHAEGGELTLVEQGSASRFGARDTPVQPLTPGETALYGDLLGTDFRDATFTPDFPRAAALMAARWEEEVGTVELDGVISIDVVALSYLLEGIGPVAAPGLTLTTDNLVETVLSTAYRLLPPPDQDTYFEDVAEAVFEAVKGDRASELRLVRAFDRAAGEGRFRMASFLPEERDMLAGSRVVGDLSGDDGAVPHVDIDLNDATGSKMSYYLRAESSVAATGCDQGVQTLAGELVLHQTIDQSDAARLTDYVTGGGKYGTDPGAQLILVRLYAPHGGELTGLRVDGQDISDVAKVLDFDGRPAVTLSAYVDSQAPVLVEWDMTTSTGQSADVIVTQTPGMTPGTYARSVESAC
ncbi:DUF4012 domain-containing protein [Nocardioides sp.]|uniref:DUF4012 domain-containing protein n=1 Tax=Nocardioides sp. TaxID=35761 RepID=UPI00286B5C15|nr:DUF4012 domain-containing protein [Nocardioides sp.]